MIIKVFENGLVRVLLKIPGHTQGPPRPWVWYANYIYGDTASELLAYRQIADFYRTWFNNNYP